MKPATVPALVPAALALTMLGGLVLGARLFREHRELDGELAILRAAQTSGVAKSALPPGSENARLSSEYENETALLRVADAKALEFGKALPRMTEEEWHSLGRVEELGQQAADFLGFFTGLADQAKNRQPVSEADNSRVMGDIVGWMKRLEAIGEMEDDPAEIARLHAATLSARMKLDAAVQERVQKQIEREFTQLREQKLTRPQRPDEERDDWYVRRKTALNEASQRIEALIPAVRREQFAVGQSLHLGTGLRTKTELKPDGHGSVSMGLELPGLNNVF